MTWTLSLSIQLHSHCALFSVGRCLGRKNNSVNMSVTALYYVQRRIIVAGTIRPMQGSRQLGRSDCNLKPTARA
ncbi:hypothetical protein F5X98DRAFT_325067 [Xylaria grammica]|nr:hypothetical protein F5X98DRAFT_325067 [Xylaria grammica]